MPNDNIDRERIGQYLRSVRIKHNVKLRTLAGRLGISHSVLSRVELGQDAPSDGVLNGYKREFPEIPPDVESRFRHHRRLPSPTMKSLEPYLIEAKPTLTIDSDGTCEPVEIRLIITSLTDGLRQLQVMLLMSRQDYEAARFREVRGCSLSAQPYPVQRPTHLEIFAELSQPLSRLDKHDITFTFDLLPTARQWIISPRPSLPYWGLAPSIYLPNNRIDDIELYQVNGHPVELGLTPRFEDAACVRVYPNSNGFIRWELKELIAGNLYGVRWRSRFDQQR